MFLKKYFFACENIQVTAEKMQAVSLQQVCTSLLNVFDCNELGCLIMCSFAIIVYFYDCPPIRYDGIVELPTISSQPAIYSTTTVKKGAIKERRHYSIAVIEYLL